MIQTPVILTTKTESKGRAQECPGNFPLEGEKPTVLTIWRDPGEEAFQIYTDHKEWHKFKHKMYHHEAERVGIIMKEKGIDKMTMTVGMVIFHNVVHYRILGRSYAQVL